MADAVPHGNATKRGEHPHYGADLRRGQVMLPLLAALCRNSNPKEPCSKNWAIGLSVIHALTVHTWKR